MNEKNMDKNRLGLERVVFNRCDFRKTQMSERAFSTFILMDLTASAGF